MHVCMFNNNLLLSSSSRSPWWHSVLSKSLLFTDVLKKKKQIIPYTLELNLIKPSSQIFLGIHIDNYHPETQNQLQEVSYLFLPIDRLFYCLCNYIYPWTDLNNNAYTYNQIVWTCDVYVLLDFEAQMTLCADSCVDIGITSGQLEYLCSAVNYW